MAEEHTAVADQAHPSGVDPDRVRRRVEEALATSRPLFNEFFLARLLDLTISYDDEREETRVELPFADFLRNPQGSLHGGVITTAMDISMGHLLHRYLTPGVTIEMQLRFFRPVHGPSYCEARLLRGGRRIVHLESRLYDEQGRFAAYATSTFQRLDAPSDHHQSQSVPSPGST